MHGSYFDGRKMKNGKDLGCAMDDTAVAVLQAQVGKHDQFVPTYQGKTLGTTGGWYEALKRAGTACKSIV